MKKMILLAAAAVLGLSANAQKVEKPSAGTFGLEIQMNPFDQNGHTFSLDGLKARYFVTDNDAVRLKLGFDVTKNKSKADWDEKAYNSNTTGNVTLEFGYERHFDLAPRLSAYAGAQIGLVRDFAKGKSYADKDNYIEYKNITAGGNDRAAFGFSIGAITGLDFYVYKSLYLGAELGLGVVSTKTSATTVTTHAGNAESKVEDKSATRSTNASIDIQPQLRLGWNF